MRGTTGHGALQDTPFMDDCVLSVLVFTYMLDRKYTAIVLTLIS